MGDPKRSQISFCLIERLVLKFAVLIGLIGKSGSGNLFSTWSTVTRRHLHDERTTCRLHRFHEKSGQMRIKHIHTASELFYLTLSNGRASLRLWRDSEWRS
ncbi:hypothetical protein PMI11_04448 [Rhizobium sp. CF142]|nr:hypothetical protein PMI11_04448 [Rhizobium sp. CF142]